MERAATVTSKGQITVPLEVRKALGLQTGDRVLFRVVEGRALLRRQSASEGEEMSVELEKIPDFFELAGAVPTPAGVEAEDLAAQRSAAWAAAIRDNM
jgi:AbrB family looped-hinge helix DNA binding protein